MVICLVMIGFLFALPRLGLEIYPMHTLIGVFIWIIVAGSLRVLGLSGQGSIGHVAFMAIGAYTSAILAKYLGWSLWITMPIGVMVTGVVAFLVGIPFTRVRGIYFTMVSLFFGILVLSVDQVFNKYTGGYSGMTSVKLLFGYNKVPLLLFLPGAHGGLPCHHVPVGTQPDRSHMEGCSPVLFGGFEHRHQ